MKNIEATTNTNMKNIEVKTDTNISNFVDNNSDRTFAVGCDSKFENDDISPVCVPSNLPPIKSNSSKTDFFTVIMDVLQRIEFSKQIRSTENKIEKEMSKSTDPGIHISVRIEEVRVMFKINVINKILVVKYMCLVMEANMHALDSRKNPGISSGRAVHEIKNEKTSHYTQGNRRVPLEREAPVNQFKDLKKKIKKQRWCFTKINKTLFISRYDQSSNTVQLQCIRMTYIIQ